MSWDDIKRQYGGGSNSGGWESVKAQWQAGAPARALKQQEEQQRQRAALQLAERSAQTAREAVDAVRNGLRRQPAARSGGVSSKDDADTVMRERFAQGRTSRQGQRLTDGATKQTHAEARKAEKQERAAQFADAAKQYVDIAVPAIAQGAALRIEGPKGQQRRREQAEEWQRYRDGYDSGRSVETVQAEYDISRKLAQEYRQKAQHLRETGDAQREASSTTATGKDREDATRFGSSLTRSADQWDKLAQEESSKALELATELGYAKTFYLTDKYASLAENPDFAEKSKPVEQNPGETKRPGDYEVDQSLSETYETNMPEIDIVQYRVNHNGQSPASAGTVHQEDAFMTGDERATFNYLYNTGRKDDALEYYNALSDTLEMRRGAQTAKDWDSTAARAVYNLGAGINRWVRGVGQLFTDEALPATSVDYAQGIMNSEAGRGGRILYSAANSLGNMLPSVILSAATSGAAGALGAGAKVAETAGKAASTASMFAGAKGNAYTEALRQGMTKAEAGTYSTLVGASEAGLEYLLGGISKLGMNPIGEAAEKWVSDLRTGYAKAILGPTGKLLGSAAGEVLEENIQNYLEPIFLNAVTGEEGEMPGWDEFVETTLSVLITVGLMEGPGTVSGINTNLQTTIPEMQRQWVDSALEVFPDGSSARLVAQALSERLNREEAIPVQEFRAELRELGLSESAMNKIRAKKVTLEEVQQAMTEIQRGKYVVKPQQENAAVSADAAEIAQEAARLRTAAGNAAPVYMAYGFKEDAARAAAAVTAKLAAGETITNAEVGALRLKTQRGREALSAILGIEIDSPQAFRRAELFYQQGRAAQEWGSVQLDVATLPATQESAVAILGNEQALAAFEMMLERPVEGVWQARVEQVVKGLKELQAGRGENAQTVSASEQRDSDTTSVGAAPSGFDPLSHAANEYGTIPPGENPRGDNHIVDVPKSMDGKTKVQQGTRTFIEASATQDVDMIEDAIVQGMFNRRSWNFDEMRQQATEWLNERTPTQAVVEWTSENAKKQTAQNFARGVLLYADLQKLWAAAEKGSSERQMYHDMSLEVMTALNNSATAAGEVLALMRLVKRLNPADRVELIQRGINSLNATLPNGVQVELNPDLVEAYYQALNFGDEQSQRLAEENLKRDIAAQVPKTLADRWNAWRYLCMLGNPKTIIRNAAGNLGMTGAKRLRDTVGAGLEKMFVPKEERTKATLWARNTKKGRALAEFISKNYYTDEVQDTLRGEGKYSQNLENSLRQMIREQNGTFTAPVLKQWQAATEWLMNDAAVGDAGFLRHHYVNSFVQAALARGYTAEDFARKGGIPQEVVNELQGYAVNQAQKATFRDLNAFSKLMKKLPNKDNFWGVLMQGVLPFRSTPANVAVRSVEYSPLGVAQGIQQLVRYALDKRADRPLSYSKSQIIESFSQGIVGTALFGAGFVLANAGIIHGAADDDDERKGIQSYSITIGNKNITLDWLSPSIVPLMMGAMASDMSADGAYTFDALVTSAGTMLQPMFEMSMLSGVSDLLDSFRYADSSNDVTGIAWGVFAEPFMNYLSQGIPTLLSQTTQTISDESTYTYTGDIPTGFLKKLTKSVWKMLRKTPLSLVFDDRQAEFVDEYGRTQDKGNVVERFLNSFLNPAYVSDVMETDLDAELERLEESTGTNAAPTRRGYTITVNKERKRLTKDQYDRYSREYGTQAAEMMGALLVSKQYDEMTDEERVGAFEKIGQLADKYGKISAGVGYTVKDGDADKALFDLVDSGIPVAEAYAARLYRDQLNRDPILDATTRQERFSAWVSGQSSWGQKQKDAVLDAYGTFFTQTPANTEKYEAAAKIVGTDKAMKVSDAIRTLQPEQKTDAKYEYDRAKDDTASKTYSAVRTVQRIELIAKQSGVSDKDKYALMELYTTDWRCEEFRQAGLAPKVYAEFLRGKDEYCPSGQWSDKRFAQWLASTNYSAEVKSKIRAIYNMDKP